MAIQVVILAAGLGTRLGKPHPKPLTPLTSGESIMRRAVNSLRAAYGDEVFVTAVVGFKLDLVIEAMPDISFVYNEVYDSTNTSKSLLKALRLSQPRRGALAQRGRRVRPSRARPDPRQDRGRTQLRVREHRRRSPRRRSSTPSTGTASSTSCPSRSSAALGEAVGINFVSADDKAALIARLEEADDQDYFERGLELAIEKDGLRVEAVDISQFQVVEVDFEDDLSRANSFVEG